MRGCRGRRRWRGRELRMGNGGGGGVNHMIREK